MTSCTILEWIPQTAWNKKTFETVVFSEALKVTGDGVWDEGSAVLPCLAWSGKGKSPRVSP